MKGYMTKLRKHYKGEEIMEELKPEEPIKVVAPSGQQSTNAREEARKEDAYMNYKESKEQPFFKLVEPENINNNNYDYTR